MLFETSTVYVVCIRCQHRKERKMKDLKKYTFKTLAVFLSILMIVYLVPTFVFAEWIDGLSSGASGENDEPAGRASDTYEMTERREENVKHFHCPDGTNIAVQYDMPVHYLDNGEWKDIDNTLAASGSDYSTSNARIKFAKKITGNESLFTLHDGNCKIVMSLDGARKKTAGKVTSLEKETDATETKLQKLMRLDKLSSKITYENILDGTDLEYIVFSSNVKENIIVKKKLPSYLYTFTISLNNLTAAVCGDGSVRIYDPSDDEMVYVIPRGYMVDADGARSDAVSYSVSDLGNGKYKFTVTADADWINSDGRAFPVKIDPSLNTSASDYLDVYVNTSVSGSSAVDNSYLRVGGGYRAYLKIGTLPELPEYAYITDAKVQLYCKSYLAAEGYIAAYRVTGSWTSSMVSGGSAGTLYSKAADYQYLCEDDDYQDYSWNITEIARAWYAGESNYGVAFENISSDESAEFTFGSSESTVAYERPKLIVTYRDQLGVEDYWSFISQSAGGAGIGSLNLANGNLVFSIGTLTSTDSLMPFTPTLIYNSMLTKWYYTRYSREVPYSFASVAGGFKTNISQCIVPRTYINESGASETFYVYTDADGTEHAFFRSTKSGESNIYYDEDGLKLKLMVNSSDFTITDTDFTVYTFTKKDANDSYTYAGGYLTQITDVNGNTVAFDCNSYGRPTTVKLKPNGASSYITQLEINYTTGGVISYILNPTTQQAVHLFYSSDYNTEIAAATRYLRKIVVAHQKDGNTSASNWTNFRNNDSDPHIDIDADYYYEYDSTGHLLSAEDRTHKVKISYTYDSAGRVISATEYGQGNAGQTVKIAYGTGYTDVETSGKDDDITTTADNIITRYVFDKEGRCVTCYSTDKSGKNIYGAKSGQYEDDNTRAKNSIKQSSVISDVAVNYLKNGNFESVTSGMPTGWSKSGNVTMETVKPFNENEFDVNYPVTLTATSGTVASISQSVYLLPGKYTLSADVMRIGKSDIQAFLYVLTLPASQTNAERIHFRKEYSPDESAEASLTFEITTAGTYTVYLTAVGNASISVGHMTLSKTVGMSIFSRVQNGAFELYDSASKPEYWTCSPYSAVSTVESSDLTGRTLMINGSGVGNTAYAEQTIYSASQAEINDYLSSQHSILPKYYRISGRAMSDSVFANEESTFCIKVLVKYAGENTPQTEIVEFNKYTSSWQFAGNVISTKAGKFVESIKIRCEYDNQVGSAYFDDISFCYVGTDQKITEYKYNSYGMPEYVRYGYSSYTWYKYDSGNKVIAVITRRGATEYSYTGNILTGKTTYNYIADISKPYGGYYLSGASKALVSTTSYTYNSYGKVTETRTTTADGKCMLQINDYITTAGSHIFGALKSSTDSQGGTNRFFYDESYGRLNASIGEDGNGMTYSYDALGRMTNAYPAHASGSSYSTDQTSANVSYVYDQLSRLESVSTNSTVYTFEYDVFGNNSKIKAGGSTLASYVYNTNNGKLDILTYGNGHKCKYIYDELDRIKEIQYNTSSTSTSFTTAYTYEYDANGNVSKITDMLSSQVTVFRYDSRGKLCNYYVNNLDDEDNQSALYFDYDNEGRLQKREYYRDYNASGIVNAIAETDIVYNDDGSVASIGTEVQGMLVSAEYSYDDLLRISATAWKVGDRDTDSPTTITQSYTYSNYEYEGEGNEICDTPLIHSVTTSKPDGSETLYYTYDERGNITYIRRGVSTVVCRYTYDSLGQLIREDNSVLGKTYVWTYDKAGNILSRKTYAYTIGTLGAVQNTVIYGYDNGSWGDLLISFNGQSIAYDGIGNPGTWNGNALTWQGRRLMSYGSNTYTYNADGIRTSKTVNGVEHIYHLSGTQILSEEWTEGNVQHILIYVYDASGQPIGMSHYENGAQRGTYVFVKNIQGDVIGIYDEEGTCLVTYTYDAWGNVTVSYSNGGASTAARYNPFRYRGYYYDTETSLYYLNSRFYDPNVGRFLNADGIDFLGTDEGLLSYNLFAYCLNEPVNRTDDSGNLSIKNWIKIGVGAIALGAAIALTVATGGGAAAVAIGVAKVVGSVALSTAVSAGAGYLKNGKQGAIDGACNGFMLGSLSALGGAAFKYAKVHSATTGSPNSMGKAGERMAGIDQSAKEPIQINGRTRIPDAMTDTTLIEVKNVKYISNTQQLRDFAAFANATGRSLELWVRPTTRIAKTVIDAGWHINYLW